jgi:hypothetical protein
MRKWPLKPEVDLQDIFWIPLVAIPWNEPVLYYIARVHIPGLGEKNEVLFNVQTCIQHKVKVWKTHLLSWVLQNSVQS